MRLLVTSAIMAGVFLSLAGCSAEGTTEVPVEVPEASADGSAVYQAYMDEKWANILSMFPDAERPETSIVRYLEDNEFWVNLAACMEEEGFPAEALAGGGVRFGDVPSSQALAHNLAFFTCEARYPLMDKYWADITEDQLRRLYAHHVDESIPCLQGMGYEVEPPPSIQQYLSTFHSEDQWNPFNAPLALTRSNEEGDLIYATCPYTPERWWD